MPLETVTLPSPDLLFGCSVEMQSIRRKVEVVAGTPIPVLIHGESGTGKELCARLLHQLSPRPAASMIKVNCAAISADIMERELFGSEQDTLSGSHVNKRGRLEDAHGGTLFLDDIDGLDIATQAKLSQLLQDGTYSRVGGREMRFVETRLVSASSLDLKQLVDQGRFRLDLLHRANAMFIQLPPLRRRAEDIPDLARGLLKQHAQTFGTTSPPLSRRTIQMMQSYEWPGNLRELNNLMRSYALIGSEEELVRQLMPVDASLGMAMPDVDVSRPIPLKLVVKNAVHELERQIILKVLRANAWNRQRTAKWLQISYRSLLYKLNEVGPDGMPRIRRTSSANE